MDKITYISLSDREFENKQFHYEVPYKLHDNCKPQGIWFSLPSQFSDYVSEWHEFVCSEYLSSVTRFCDENGMTNVISCQIKDKSLVVRISDISDELKKALSEKTSDDPKVSKIQKLLKLVRQKYNMSNIEHIILDIDDCGLQGLKQFFVPVTLDRKKQEILSYINGILIRPTIREEQEKEFGYNWPPVGYEPKLDITELHRDILDIIEEFYKGSTIDEIISKYPPVKLRYLTRWYKSIDNDWFFENGINREDFGKYIRENNTFDTDALFQDEKFIKLIDDDLRKELLAVADLPQKIPHIYVGAYREMFEESRNFYEIREKIDRIYNKEKSDEYRIGEGVTEYFSGMVNKSFCRDGLDMPSLAVFDTECIEVISQEQKSLFTREQIIEAIKQNIEIMDRVPEYSRQIKVQIEKFKKNFSFER